MLGSALVNKESFIEKVIPEQRLEQDEGKTSAGLWGEFQAEKEARAKL